MYKPCVCIYIYICRLPISVLGLCCEIICKTNWISCEWGGSIVSFFLSDPIFLGGKMVQEKMVAATTTTTTATTTTSTTTTSTTPTTPTQKKAPTLVPLLFIQALAEHAKFQKNTELCSAQLYNDKRHSLWLSWAQFGSVGEVHHCAAELDEIAGAAELDEVEGAAELGEAELVFSSCSRSSGPVLRYGGLWTLAASECKWYLRHLKASHSRQPGCHLHICERHATMAEFGSLSECICLSQQLRHKSDQPQLLPIVLPISRPDWRPLNPE